ncbi:MAG: hypothetical protein WAK17_26295 [Candidatus Nitrosopolaris sp.]|jgi:hypothetical protein
MQRTLTTAQKTTQLLLGINGTRDLSMATEKYGWWISELNSLGVNTEAKNEELRDVQALENLTDDLKQTFIHEYKTRYSEEY